MQRKGEKEEKIKERIEHETKAKEKLNNEKKKKINEDKRTL